MPFLVAGLGLLVVAVLAAMRGPRQGGGAGGGDAGGLPPPQRNTGAVSLTTAAQRTGDELTKAPPKDLLGMAGYIGGQLAGAAALTNTGKAAALPVGIGVAAAAALAAVATGATLAAAAVWVIPVVLVTVAIVSIIDLVARAAQSEKWPHLVMAIARMRETGDIPGAQLLYLKAIDEISAIARVWPRQGDWWFNYADPSGLGKPYPGFPGMPAPASEEELARWPHLIPEWAETAAGTPGEVAAGAALPWLPVGRFNIRQLLDAFEQDIRDVRAWGLANGVEGLVLLPGKDGRDGRPLAPRTNQDHYFLIAKATTGARDIRGWAPMLERLTKLEELRRSLAASIPWLQQSAFSSAGVLSPYEVWVDSERRRAVQGMTGKSLDVVEGKVVRADEVDTTPLLHPAHSNRVSERQVAAITRTTGLTGVAAVEAAQAAQAAATQAAAEAHRGSASTTATGASGTTGNEADGSERRGTGPARTGGGTS